jgi:mRNA-degrading endonuclease toxin of MazEF toxin-antitoxin module
MVEKVRPVLILSIPFADADRALVTVVFHTTAVRNSQFEVKIEVPFLKDGAFRRAKHRHLPDRSRHSQTRCAKCNAIGGS